MSNPEKQADIIYLPLPQKQELTPEQEEHWWQQLEIAERKVEFAKRVLGLLQEERGLEG